MLCRTHMKWDKGSEMMMTKIIDDGRYYDADWFLENRTTFSNKTYK